MAKPVILAVDDDPQVLRAVERDLRRNYAREYRVLRADSGASALDTLEKIRERGDPVALMLVDQRMPRMSGVEFLEEARGMFPDAKRALLTAYADTDAAIRAINNNVLHYYLQKPWDPPEERLYPTLDDLLEDWQASYRPPFEGIRLVGHRWSPRSFELRDFLGRNQISYQWLDVQANEDSGRSLDGFALDGKKLPLVVLPDGTELEEPETREVAERIGLRSQAEKPFYDLVIVGAGPAGLATAVYGASEGLRTVMVEREAPGGQAGTSSRIENYLGFPSGLSGADLARRAVTQAKRFGVEILTPQEVVGVRVEDPYRIVELSDGSEISCHALVISSGVSYRKLDAPGLDRFTGAGVYYGASMSEARSCQGEHVFIVGGANSAGQAAVYFAEFAGKVTMLIRSGSLEKGMSRYLVDQIRETENIEVRTNSTVAGVNGEDSLESVTVKNGETGAEETLAGTSLFIFIGAEPRTGWLDGVVERDRRGFVLAGSSLWKDGSWPKSWKLDRDPHLLETSVPGIFVAGDVVHGSTKRIAYGVGGGAVAVQLVHQRLSEV